MNDPTTPLNAAALQRRGLFPYHDGVRSRIGDVLAIQFRLQAACPGGDIDRLDVLLDAIAPPALPSDPTPPADPDSGSSPPSPPVPPLAAMVELAPIIGAAFDLPRFDETTGVGLSIQERIGLLTDYLGAAVGADGDDDADEVDPESEPEPEWASAATIV